MTKEEMLEKILDKLVKGDYFKNPIGLINCATRNDVYTMSIEIDKDIIKLVYYNNRTLEKIYAIDYHRPNGKFIKYSEESEWMIDKMNEIVVLVGLGAI